MFSKIWSEIKQKQFAPLYLLYGEEQFLIDKTKSLIISEALEEHETEFNLSVYDLEETPVEVAIEDAETVPFFGDRKIVILQNPYFLTAEKVKEKVEHDTKGFESYINDPVPSTILVLVGNYEKLDERKKLTKSLMKNAVTLHSKKLNEPEIKEWIMKQVSEQNSQITEEAAELLSQLIGPNLTILHNELEKLLLYKNTGEKIDTEMVDLLVSRSLEDNVFALVDKIMQKKLAEVLEIYFDLLKQNEEPIKILAVIASQFRLFYQVKSLTDRGYGQKQIASILKVHPFRVKLAVDKAKYFPMTLLLRVIDELTELDYKMKSGAGDKERLLELFFIRLLS